ncbi:MAG: restriction endonuclease subunit S [Aestuariivirga sp.]|uniref:restriction endonuclease subunit S n=1 Tax=Aestuariivirga sp. TaxID=2650926 RepID=UPI00301B0CAA
MSAERLLQHYEQIADSPDAIVRLRRFILDLAVRGKLVPQEASDEPASELLKRIAKEKTRLEIGGRRRGSASRSEPSFDEADLPKGWAAVQGFEIFPTRSGNSKLIKGTLHSEAADGLFPGYSAAGQDVWLDGWEHEGDAIILSAVGARCGKAFLATGKWSAVANTHIVWLLEAVTVPTFAMLHLNNEAFWVRSGGAQPFIKVKETLDKIFPLPPLAEQHRIVAKVDELMGLCDRLEAARAAREAVRDRLTAASLARLNAPDAETFQNDARFAQDALPALTTRPDQIKRLRQTILNLAVRGKLVPHDPNDEPASELLKRIAKERTEPQSVKKARRNGETDVSNLRTDTPLPVGWLWTNIDEIALSMRYGTSTKCEYAAPGVPVLRIPNVSDGIVSLVDIKFGPLTDGEIRDLALNAGDLLMIRSNGRAITT